MAINLLDEIKTDFITYANCVNRDRAFPDARDGLKPSQRAVLWEMYDKKYFSNKPHVKSAKVDGGVIANWHPHGSEYPTIVRMSQDWLNNIPEISFHGSNGSVIGGPTAAASRYTECRLSEAVEDGFFAAIDKHCVNFIPNYTKDNFWPEVFPAIFPRLFVNGSQGIGYTIAQGWAPGNLTEFVSKVKEYIKTKTITYEDIYPDFPSGGTIINKSDIAKIYETGTGSISLQGKSEISDNSIIITELPYQTYAEEFIQTVKDLCNAEKIKNIADICNKSDDNGLCIEIICEKDPETILQQLYKLTKLRYTFDVDQKALVNGYPKLLSLKDYIAVYVNHNIECIVNEYRYSLDKANARKEILDGLVRALTMIDDIISTIKQSKSAEIAKSDLISKYTFTQSQAQAIVDMRLGRLANLEKDELNKELSEILKIITNCNAIINSEKNQQKEFLKRLDCFANKYAWTRKTSVIDIDLAAEKAQLKQIKGEKNSNVVICLTKGKLLKKISIDNYKPNKVTSEENQIITAITVPEKSRFIVVTEAGMMYKLSTKDIMSSNMNAQGIDVSEYINNESIIDIFTEEQDSECLFLITNKGQGKKIRVVDAFGISKNVGASIIKLDTTEKLIACKILDTPIIEINFSGKTQKIDTSKYLAKGRFAGGQACIKIKKTKKESLWE